MSALPETDFNAYYKVLNASVWCLITSTRCIRMLCSVSQLTQPALWGISVLFWCIKASWDDTMMSLRERLSGRKQPWRSGITSCIWARADSSYLHGKDKKYEKPAKIHISWLFMSCVRVCVSVCVCVSLTDRGSFTVFLLPLSLFPHYFLHPPPPAFYCNYRHTGGGGGGQ